MTDALEIYTVYENPSDYPGRFVVRRSQVVSGQREPVMDARPTAVTQTLNAARAAIPLGLVSIERSPQDEPHIVEVWL